MSHSKQNDASLIRSIAGAQTEALSELYDRYNRLVFTVAYAILGDRATADEVTVDVFVRVWRGAGSYRPESGKVRTWLVAITRHHAVDILRWQNSRPDSNSLLLKEGLLSNNETIRNPEEETEMSLQRKRVRGALAQLPDDQRQALVLAYFRGYTHEQIAEQLKQPLGTIKTRIRLAMQKLRHLLEDERADASDDNADTYLFDEKE
jgi:RNA polymerase sigma-70 factor (ECF subfamily)